MRIALAIEYNGNGYCGWQRQPHCLSVQQAVEEVLSGIADTPITIICAGRTDTGVHAFAQVVHFDCPVHRPERAWTFGANSDLDRRIAIHWASKVAEDFHARFSATKRSYRYLIHNRRTRPGVHSGLMSWVNQPLDHESMQKAAEAIVGTHDFSSFRSADCQARQPVRSVESVAISRREDLVTIDITANGFLHNMVRIIAGSLVKIGRGERPVDWMAELLAARDRTLAGATLAPGGLYFLQPEYPPQFRIPDFSPLWAGNTG